MTAIEAPARAGRREWIGLAVLALACVLYVMDLTVLYLALPAISADGAAVAFFSAATNLVAGDANQTGDVFVRELAL